MQVMLQLRNNKELEKVFYHAPLPAPSSPDHPKNQDPWLRKVYKLDGSSLDFVDGNDGLAKAIMQGKEVEEELAVIKSGWKMIDPSSVVLEEEKGKESSYYREDTTFGKRSESNHPQDSDSYGHKRTNQQRQPRKSPPTNPSKLTKEIMKPIKVQKKEAKDFLRDRRRKEKLRRQAIIEGKDIEMFMITGSDVPEPRTHDKGGDENGRDKIYGNGRTGASGSYWPSDDERKRSYDQRNGEKALREERRQRREELSGHTCE